jgi:putative hydrolase of the HAD superfamily
MITAVLFDLDGTLCDRDTTVRRLVEAQYDAYAGALAHVAKPAFITRFMALDARGYVPKDVVYRQLVAEFALQAVSAEELMRYYVAHYHQHCVPFPGLIDVLADLRRQALRLGVITNGATVFQLNTMRALDIESAFRVVLISEAEGIKKPDPAIFHRAAARLGVEPGESLFVGDHPVVDVLGARNAGLKAIWKRDAYWEPPAEADGVIDDLRELPARIHTHWSTRIRIQRGASRA